MIPYLNSLPDSKLTIIDVGCHKAHFKEKIAPNLTTPAFWIGIDPCDYWVGYKYDVFINKAISNVSSETTLPFHKYIEPGCNSLLRMKTEDITHDPSQKDQHWFVGWEIEKEIETVPVPVVSFLSIIEEQGLQNSIIHLIKIDTQGNDIEVVRSLGKYLKNVMFIQMECVSSHNENITLYQGQYTMEQDIDEMKSMGFLPFKITDYGVQGASPEADILFYNTVLVSNEDAKTKLND